MNIDKFHPLIESALREDIGRKDITTETITPNSEVEAVIVAKEDGVIAGLDIAHATFHHIAETTEFKRLVKDGDKIYRNQIVVWLRGKAKNILVAERTALNFLNHLSGIATLTSKYVELTKPYNCKILDTRKTTPCLRELEKYAVRMGGGENHRFQLDDMVLIKDNHLKLSSSPTKITDLVALAKRKFPEKVLVEVEVNSVEEAQEAYQAGADIIMLDNMSVEEIRRVVEEIKGKGLDSYQAVPILEASGGINLLNVAEVASTGVDWISIGEITHSAPALNTSLEIV
ncbi:MAG TPA: carboxylating nicotinate-nucleotide diphosphorylase [Candidatus Omnitrophica bacterium]|nr:carboxylating nicotinate-nucleotide diphosphorylase [Candidatus Omnitrophota bacterium]